MQIYISPNTFKKQTKILVKSWPEGSLKSLQARKLLCSLYGYKTPHHYHQLASTLAGSVIPANEHLFTAKLDHFVQQLAFLGNLKEQESFSLLKLLWPKYIQKKRFFPHRSSFAFYGDLNDFLLQENKNKTIEYRFQESPAIKDTIEALGVPHPEVELILVNGKSVDFSYQLQENDQIQVYPPYHQLNVAEDEKLPVFPQGKPKFILDVHLGSLARYLRMAGFDTWYEATDRGDQYLADTSGETGSIVLSRDIGLLKRASVCYGHWMRNSDPKKQFQEVVEYYQLASFFEPFCRCTECNDFIHPVDKEDVREKVPDYIYEYQQSFQQCQGCQKIYWKGTHYDRMQKFLTQFH
ncbi:MAG: hypothetical protein ACI86H_001080 [bacterium]|jgi:uncharacterized protein with PIN domain